MLVADMDKDRKKEVKDHIIQAFMNFNSESRIANNLKATFDKAYGPSWNVIIGENFGSHVINQTNCYMFASYNNDEQSILIWKS